MDIATKMNNYYNLKYIDINKFLTEKDKKIIRKLGISLSNGLYTLYQYELLMQKISLFYINENEMTKKEQEKVKSLDRTGVNRDEFNNLYEKMLEKVDVIYIM